MYSENFVSKKLKSFAEKNEWLVSGEYIYGEEQGFLFTGLDGKGQKTFITPVPGITEEQSDELLKLLEKNKGTMKLTEYSISDDFLCIRIKDSMQLKTDDIEFILALLVGCMQELFIIPVGVCQECGKPGSDSENFLYDLYCYMHEDCAKSLESDSHSDVNKETSNDSENSESENSESENSKTASDLDITSQVEKPDDVSTVKKILFTIGGAILGAAPWLLLPFVMDMLKDLISKITENAIVINFTQSLLTCICAYLVSYIAIIAYRLSKAKMDTKGRWIIGGVSIAVVILVQFVSLAILIAKEPSVNLTFTNYLTNLSKQNFYVNILLGALIGVVFTLIAVLPFFDSSLSSSQAKTNFIARNKAKKADLNSNHEETLSQENDTVTELDSDSEITKDSESEN